MSLKGSKMRDKVMGVFQPQILLEVWNIKSSIFAHYILASLSSGVQLELLFKTTNK